MQDDSGRTAPNLPPRRPQETFDEAKARAVKAFTDLGCSKEDAVEIVNQAVGSTSGLRAVRYLSAEGLTHDDFGVAFTNETDELVYDAKTAEGPWATMTHESWLQHRATERLGTGLGQCYKRQANGHLIKVEG